MNKENTLYMPSERCMAELVLAVVTGADLDYIGSITIDPEALDVANLLAGQMVYIDDIIRKGPSWRTYIVAGTPGRGEVIMNGPPAHHFKKGDPVTIRAGALVSFEDLKGSMRGDHTKVYFTQNGNMPNCIANYDYRPIPNNHWRQMCISKLHRIMVTESSPDGPEALIVDEDILDAAGFPEGIEVQFTSLKDGSLRRTSIQADRRGSGMAKIQGSGAQYIEAGTRLVTLAEAWLPYEDAKKVGGPQVAFFDEAINTYNVIREVKPGWRPS